MATDVLAALAGIVQSHSDDIRAEVFGLASTPMRDADVAQVGQVWAERMQRVKEPMTQPEMRDVSTNEMPIDQIIAMAA